MIKVNDIVEINNGQNVTIIKNGAVFNRDLENQFFKVISVVGDNLITVNTLNTDEVCFVKDFQVNSVKSIAKIIMLIPKEQRSFFTEDNEKINVRFVPANTELSLNIMKTIRLICEVGKCQIRYKGDKLSIVSHFTNNWDYVYGKLSSIL